MSTKKGIDINPMPTVTLRPYINHSPLQLVYMTQWKMTTGHQHDDEVCLCLFFIRMNKTDLINTKTNNSMIWLIVDIHSDKKQC